MATKARHAASRPAAEPSRSAKARARARHDAEDAHAKGDAPVTPPALAALLEGLKKLELPGLQLPGLDLAGLMDGHRKDVEAVVAANQQAWRGLEAVTRRQGEMLAAAVDRLRQRASELTAPESASGVAGAAARDAQAAIGHVLADLKELAELSAQSQQQVLHTINQRLQARMEEAGARLSARP